MYSIKAESTMDDGMLLLITMFSRAIIFAFLASTFAADHNLFKDCSRVDFCRKLRSSSPDDDTKYRYDSYSVNQNANVNLVNNKGSSVNVQISALKGDKFRVQIDEKNNQRYKLTDVLVEEPAVQSISYQSDTDSGLTLAVSENSNAKVEVAKNPLAINFYFNNKLHTTINGDRLYFENTDSSQVFTVSVSFPLARKMYGLHEHAEHLSLQSTAPGGTDPYRLKNLDVFACDVYSPMALYGAAPVLYGLSSNENTTSGIFLHNAAQQWIETTNNVDSPSAYFMVEGGSLDIFVLPGPNPKEVVRQYTNLTGTAHLPQIWALGYQQSRYNYVSQDDVKDVIANMDSYDFPMDSIWLDIDYTDGKKYFTWDPNQFSDPLEMQHNISSTNRKLVTIIDPHYKVDDDYPVYKNAAEKGLFIKRADGSDFQADCWPGLSSYFDFLNPAARDYYASMFSYENFPNTTETLAGIWNDMNEPSVFNSADVENTMPPDTVHIGGVKHRDVHNIYGFLQTKATHQGLMQRDNNQKRPFILTRSTFAGSQRYAAFWTGDNVADWNYLEVSYPECTNANIMGMVFCGSDVGGFVNNPTDELYQRWYQAGVWLPFYRGHSDKSTNRREPYLFSDDVQKVVRDAIKLRYQHLPVWYTLFYKHTRTGDPLIRPLFYQYPTNPDVLDIDNEILVGRDILVRPVTQSGVQSVQVYFPEESQVWYQLGKDNVYYQGISTQDIPVDMNQIPVFYRGGSIISRKDTPKKCTTDMKDDSYTLYVNLDKDGKADGTLYNDDTVSFDYTKKMYNYVSLTWSGSNVTISPIDSDADSDKFPINIAQVVVNSVTNLGYKGTYNQKVFRTTFDGTPLTQVKIDPKRKTVLKLK